MKVIRWLLVWVLLMIALTSCGTQVDPDRTPTRMPARLTSLPLPTSTPLPTDTPLPSVTPAPSTTQTDVPPTLTEPPYDPAAEIDAYLSLLTENDDFSGTVLVAREGQVLLSKGYGFADREAGIPNTPQTKFRIGSITKQFTAIAILLLQDRGDLDTKSYTCQYIPDCPEAWEKITIHRLLTHTAGLPDFTELPGYFETQGEPVTPLEMINRFKNEPLEFQPGEEWGYSNSGYTVLGYIIEEVSGQSYADFIQENIYQPLGMVNSGFDHNQDVIARGYKGRGGNWEEADYIDASVPYAAGALYSTVEDMYRWDQALYTEALVPQELLYRMFTPFADTPIGGYGYGWFITEKYHRPVILHGGGGDGFVAKIERYPEDGVTVIIQCNRETIDLGEIVDQIGSLVFYRN
jgi:CubicO group peptidase (beta-lactamase class C family)